MTKKSKNDSCLLSSKKNGVSADKDESCGSRVEVRGVGHMTAMSSRGSGDFVPAGPVRRGKHPEWAEMVLFREKSSALSHCPGPQSHAATIVP